MVAGALRRAMTAASVSVVGPTGEKRTPHAFRHTFAKIALEQGRPITWVQRQLGHSTIVVTVDRYGHFEAAAQRREAEALDAAFGGVG